MILHTPFGLFWTTPQPDEKNLFLKILFREIQKVLYGNPTFFLGKLNKNYLLRYTLTTLVILNTMFGLIWTTPWPDAKELFLKCSKIRNSGNSQNSVWKPNFFLDTLYQFFFALHSHYTGDTPYPVWFDLDNSLTRWKKPIFKIHFSRNSKSSVRKTNFFPRQAKEKNFFALHSHYTGDSPYRVWFDLDNSLTRWKKPIFKIAFSRNSKSSVWKLKFFPRQAKPILFCFTLSLHWWNSMPSLVWFGQLLDPKKNNYF